MQETLIIPLYARKMCSELFPNLYYDETPIRLIDKIDYDFSETSKKSDGCIQRFGFLEVAMRQNDVACEIRDYLGAHQNAADICSDIIIFVTRLSAGCSACRRNSVIM